jgi:hypothetical protein
VCDVWCDLLCALQRLLGCEGVKLEFTPEAISELAAMAEQLNKEVRHVQWVGLKFVGLKSAGGQGTQQRRPPPVPTCPPPVFYG